MRASADRIEAEGEPTDHDAHDAPTQRDEDVGLVGQTLLGRLHVVRRLGIGAMGSVYEVEHLVTRHRRALKVLHAKYKDDGSTLTRFVREAGVAGTLRSPFVVETFDAGRLEDGSAYVLMELLVGVPLSQHVMIGRSLAPSRIAGIACQVLRGLAAAHAAGIVHRDLKPENVFVARMDDGRERVKLLDFGISKFLASDDGLTSDGTMLGTPYYMSPEQASTDREVDARADLYALGVILYEGLAGRMPFEASTLAALISRIHDGDHVPLGTAAPEVAPGLVAVVERAMSVDREARFPSADAMYEALAPYADPVYLHASGTLHHATPHHATPHHATLPTSSAPPAPRPYARWSLLAIGVCLVIAASLALIAAAAPPIAEAPPSPPSPAAAAPVASSPSPPEPEVASPEPEPTTSAAAEEERRVEEAPAVEREVVTPVPDRSRTHRREDRRREAREASEAPTSEPSLELERNPYGS